MKNILLPVLLCTSITVIAQETNTLMQVVDAEKSFAAYARSSGIKEAFLKFLDDSARVFDKGRILNGKEVWSQRNTGSAELLWYPEFADVSASGDMGYTTGPAEYRVNKGSEKADHKGYFNSIWKKKDDGQWKVVLDMGTPSPGSEYDEGKVDYLTKQPSVKKIFGNKRENIKEVEENFLRNYDNGRAYEKFSSKTARYYRPGMKVMKGEYVSNDSLSFKYTIAGGEMASSGDLAYVYGYVTVSGKEGNYLRVWKKEMNDWKIVLDVATY